MKKYLTIGGIVATLLVLGYIAVPVFANPPPPPPGIEFEETETTQFLAGSSVPANLQGITGIKFITPYTIEIQRPHITEIFYWDFVLKVYAPDPLGGDDRILKLSENETVHYKYNFAIMIPRWSEQRQRWSWGTGVTPDMGHGSLNPE